MRSFIQKRFVYVFSGEYIVKSGTLEFDTDQPVTNLKTTDDIPNQITPSTPRLCCREVLVSDPTPPKGGFFGGGSVFLDFFHGFLR